jgi:hypothetical protein
MVPDVLAGDPALLGERFARVFLSLWSNPEFREPMLALLRSATTSEGGAVMLREFVGSALLGRLAQSLEGPDVALRIASAAAQMVGVAMLRYVIKIPPLVNATDEEIVALVAPALQSYLAPDRPPEAKG